MDAVSNYKEQYFNIASYSKKCEKGLTTIENGALLTKRGHRALNITESLDKILYEEWNNLFYLINQSKQYPSLEYEKEAKKLKKCTQKLIYG